MHRGDAIYELQLRGASDYLGDSKSQIAVINIVQCPTRQNDVEEVLLK